MNRHIYGVAHWSIPSHLQWHTESQFIASELNQHDMNSYFIIYKYFIHIFIFFESLNKYTYKNTMIVYSKVLLYEDILIGEVNLSATPMRMKSSKKLLQNLL